jgi:hypothetical protein
MIQACIDGDVEGVRSMVDTQSREWMNMLIGGWTILLHALQDPRKPSIESRVEILELLLRSGADVNCAGDTHISPLSTALYKRQPLRIIEILLGHGASLDANTLYYAVNYDDGHKVVGEVVDCVLSAAADRDERGVTHGNLSYPPSDDMYVAFFDAVCKGMVEVVDQLLVKRGFDPNHVRGGIVTSALQCACCYGHEAMTLLLLKHGARADYSYRDDDLVRCGRIVTALRFAIERGKSVACVQHLRSYGASLCMDDEHTDHAIACHTATRLAECLQEDAESRAKKKMEDTPKLHNARKELRQLHQRELDACLHEADRYADIARFLRVGTTVWNVRTHALFPARVRERAVQLVFLGYRLGIGRDVWQQHVIPRILAA